MKLKLKIIIKNNKDKNKKIKIIKNNDKNLKNIN